MNKIKTIGLSLLVLISGAGYAQCDFKSFLDGFFYYVPESSDTLVELRYPFEKIQKMPLYDYYLMEENEMFHCATKYFLSKEWKALAACRIDNYYVLIFVTQRFIDDEFDIEDDMFVLCNKKGEILDRYTYRYITRSYMTSGGYYLQKDKLIWRYRDDIEYPSGPYTEQQFKIINDKIVPLP